MSDTVSELLTTTRTIAVVGASADPARPSHSSPGSSSMPAELQLRAARR